MTHHHAREPRGCAHIRLQPRHLTQPVWALCQLAALVASWQGPDKACLPGPLALQIGPPKLSPCPSTAAAAPSPQISPAHANSHYHASSCPCSCPPCIFTGSITQTSSSQLHPPCQRELHIPGTQQKSAAEHPRASCPYGSGLAIFNCN